MFPLRTNKNTGKKILPFHFSKSNFSDEVRCGLCEIYIQTTRVIYCPSYNKHAHKVTESLVNKCVLCCFAPLMTAPHLFCNSSNEEASYSLNEAIGGRAAARA